MHLLHVKNFPIYKQLQLEEALLRLSSDNFCLINEGSSEAIVMGISGKAEELLHSENYAASPLPLIKRFSGGGTVVVDENTLFISFICQKELHPFPPYPEPIMRWTEEIYKKALKLPLFHLRENDYVIGQQKCGGNAQYIRKERWLHHSTFLWDYKQKNMDLLLLPKKTPPYREKRSHENFLTTLSKHFSHQDQFILSFKDTLSSLYSLTETSLQELAPFLALPHRQTTQLICL